MQDKSAVPQWSNNWLLWFFLLQCVSTILIRYRKPFACSNIWDRTCNNLHFSLFSCCCLVSLFYSSSALIQAAEVPHLISLTVVEVGDNVTFHCPVSENDKLFHWYQQPIGQMGQTIAAVIFGKIKVSEHFNDSRFTVAKKDAHFSVTIRNVRKEDEATYFCLNGPVFSQTFIYGRLLTVNGKYNFCSMSMINYFFKIFR